MHAAIGSCQDCTKSAESSWLLSGPLILLCSLVKDVLNVKSDFEKFDVPEVGSTVSRISCAQALMSVVQSAHICILTTCCGSWQCTFACVG